MFMIFLNLCLYGEERCNMTNYVGWLKVSLGYYLFDFIICMNQLMYIKKHGKESIKLLAVVIAGLVFNTCWYIYGNVIYFKYKDVCWNEAAGLTQSMQLMVMLSYVVFIKCCCLSVCLCVCVPLLFSAVRR